MNELEELNATKDSREKHEIMQNIDQLMGHYRIFMGSNRDILQNQIVHFNLDIQGKQDIRNIFRKLEVNYKVLHNHVEMNRKYLPQIPQQQNRRAPQSLTPLHLFKLHNKKNKVKV